MKCIQFLILAGLFLITSCVKSYQFNVRVANSSEQDIYVSYKSDSHKEGPKKEERVLIESGETKLLFSTREIPIDMGYDNTGTVYCSQVANFITATTTGGVQSLINWCDTGIIYNHVDLGQGEYTIEYGNDDF